jgi:hypothetical protein
VLVHVPDERPDLAIRELVHAVAENPLVFEELGEGAYGFGLILDHVSFSVRGKGLAEP